MIITSASLVDYPSLRRLEQACFGKDAWSFLELIAVLSYSEVARLKAVEENSMVGFIAGDPRPSEGWAWIATLAVDPKFQRRGIGRDLLRACEKKLNLPKIKLTVRTSNLAAIALYESEGYLMTDIWKGYYRDGEDGMVMEKNLA